MTRDKGLFDTLNSTPTGDLIRIADDKEYVAKGIGTINIPLTEGSCSLSNVLYVPGFTSNLLSISQLLNHKLKVEFQVQVGIKPYLISCDGEIITHGFKQGHLFALDVASSHGIALCASTVESTSLWHYRYGHLPACSLSLLQSHAMVEGLPLLSSLFPICSGCLTGKQHHDDFLFSSYHAIEHLALVHTDLCGPFPASF